MQVKHSGSEVDKMTERQAAEHSGILLDQAKHTALCR